MRSPLRLLPASLLIASLGCHVHQIAPLDPERLSREEILEEHFTNVFKQPSQIWVYYDENRLGGVNEMRSVLVNSVASLRHYNGVDATMRWGVGHSAGAIQILSHR